MTSRRAQSSSEIVDGEACLSQDTGQTPHDEKEGPERTYEVEQACSVELENSLRVGCSTRGRALDVFRKNE